jgi:hypothetical protein
VANGILMGALAGFGKGMVDVGRQEAEQANQLERMQAQKQMQIDLEKYRADTMEALRQKRGAAIKSAADAELANFEGPMRDQDRSRVLANKAAEYDGRFDQLHSMDVQDRQVATQERRAITQDKLAENRDKREERMTNSSIAAQARAANADKRNQEEHDFKMGEAGAKLYYMDAYRDAILSGDDTKAAKYAKVLGVSGNDRSTTAQLASNYIALAGQYKDSFKPEEKAKAEEYRQMADLLLRGAAESRSPSSSTPKARNDSPTDPDNLPRPKSRAEVEALKPGQPFIDPSGTKRIR